MALSLVSRDASEPFELKGSLFTLTVLHLKKTSLAAIEKHLSAKVDQAPGFFNNMPAVIDLAAVANSEIDFAGLYALLRRYGLAPVGARNGNEATLKAAAEAGLPTLPEARSSQSSDKEEKTEEPVAENKKTGIYRVHEQPVRTGQQLYSAGDLIVLGTVSDGAELLADGNIHVYGTLRGRALAGVQGDQNARIFCQGLEAHLVSIAGQYKILEELDESTRNSATHIYLSQERLMIEPLLNR